MPELPDVEILRRYIENTSIGQKITSACIENTRLLRTPASNLQAAMEGKSFAECTRHGKLLFVKTEGGSYLVLHFGMTGNLKYIDRTEEKPTYTRMLIKFGNGHFLAYTSIRMLGLIDLAESVDEYVQKHHLGPDAIAKELDFDRFKEIFGRSRSNAKSALMDQKKLAGIGNIYSDEILFQAEIHPTAKIDELSDEKLRNLFRKTKQVLKEAIDYDADSREFPESWLIPHRTKGEDCPKGNGKIDRIKVSGRTAYFCPACQRF